jgi:hypothetical protein
VLPGCQPSASLDEHAVVADAICGYDQQKALYAA